MAAPATHIIFADAFLQTTTQFSRADFIIGTSFPDIRHLGSISREASHLQPIDLTRIYAEQDPFMAGMRFHNYVDLMRSAYWQETGMLDQLPQAPYLQQALKLREDIALYDHVTDWPQVVRYFDSIPTTEQDFTVPEGDIQHWHNIVAQYIAERPTLESAVHFKTQFKTPPTQQQISEMTEFMHMIGAIPNLDNAIHDMHRTIVSSFTAAPQDTGQPLLFLVK
jgi:hypothetical protein